MLTSRRVVWTMLDSMPTTMLVLTGKLISTLKLTPMRKPILMTKMTASMLKTKMMPKATVTTPTAKRRKKTMKVGGKTANLKIKKSMPMLITTATLATRAVKGKPKPKARPRECNSKEPTVAVLETEPRSVSWPRSVRQRRTSSLHRSSDLSSVTTLSRAASVEVEATLTWEEMISTLMMLAPLTMQTSSKTQGLKILLTTLVMSSMTTSLTSRKMSLTRPMRARPLTRMVLAVRMQIWTTTTTARRRPALSREAQLLVASLVAPQLGVHGAVAWPTTTKKTMAMKTTLTMKHQKKKRRSPVSDSVPSKASVRLSKQQPWSMWPGTSLAKTLVKVWSNGWKKAATPMKMKMTMTMTRSPTNPRSVACSVEGKNNVLLAHAHARTWGGASPF
mmetsp:Transcript_36364/g.87817  ORF Transcript_36364/g.87817 Transcript_36364/m.87817 type:complete len:391 (+) Transcript_36364:1298-2470(+)